jgi:N-acetylmuramoyl-L-alanine amidase
LLGVLGSLGQSGTSTGDLLRLLHPVRRAVVETYRPGTNTVVRVNKPVRHVIERGDTLSEIAQAHGLDLQTLTRLNGIDPKRPIHPGVELKLSAQGSRRPTLYVVKAGDNLAKVARRFGVSQKALMDVNRLDDRRLSKGQKLVLPR